MVSEMESNFSFVRSLCLGVLLTGLTTLGLTHTTYAGQWILDESNEWYYVKDNGQYATNETLLDDKGNVYTFDENSVMRHSTDYNGLSWDDSGAWVNRMAMNKEALESKFQEYLKNGVVTFSSKTEYIDFLNHVSSNYLLDGSLVYHYVDNSGNYIFKKEANDNFEKALSLYYENLEYLTSIANQCKGATDAETVRNITNYIVDKTTYDVNYGYAITILTEGRGRCSSYTRLFKILCNLSGIECEEVYCDALSNGQYHAMTRTWYDGRWHYVDLTYIDSSKNYDKYFDIDYNILLNLFALRNNGLYSY